MYKLSVFLLVLVEVAQLTDITYYEILGISKQSSTQEIKQAYKKLAIKYHPDKNSNSDVQEKFLKITEAYETLKDPEKRSNYDLYGTNTYARKYDYHTEREYNNLFYNGLYHEDPNVDTLSSKNFYNYLGEGFYFINFYSPFCPPCQNLADHWKKLGELYKGIVKVAAVNCKAHTSFCYNSMRISSYPTLLFYPNGKYGNYMQYRGDRTLNALDEFIMTYLKTRIHIPVLSQLRKADNPIAFVLGSNRIDRNILTRIAYQLNGLISLVIVDDDELREKLTKDDAVTIVFKYIDTVIEITDTEEKEILQAIVDSLPSIQKIDANKFKAIRTQLRNGDHNPWVIYFSADNQNKLLLHQIRLTFPEYHFGELDCNEWRDLCVSLQAETTPTWGLLKRDGIYQRAPMNADIKNFIRSGIDAVRLHTLSASDLTRILDGEDVDMWVLLVSPYQVAWDHIAESFTRTSLQFLNSPNINFGIMECTLSTDKYCRTVASNQPAIILQNGTKRFYYSGRLQEHQLLEFINAIRDSPDLELSEKEIMEIINPSIREYTWLVAFMPFNCGEICDDLFFEWITVAKRLRPLEFVKVGAMRCNQKSGFCNNIRSPTIKMYPMSSGQHYTVSMQHLSQAPYMLEWALERIDDSVQKLNWHTFAKKVIAEELHPARGKKPWLVYFHSPRCFSCYERYPEFAISGIFLNGAVDLGKVNCLSERNLCQHEQITSYPTLKLYLNRNEHHRFSSSINIIISDYKSIIHDIRQHLMKYDSSLIASLDAKNQAYTIKHDEF